MPGKIFPQSFFSSFFLSRRGFDESRDALFDVITPVVGTARSSSSFPRVVNCHEENYAAATTVISWLQRRPRPSIRVSQSCSSPGWQFTSRATRSLVSFPPTRRLFTILLYVASSYTYFAILAYVSSSIIKYGKWK